MKPAWCWKERCSGEQEPVFCPCVTLRRSLSLPGCFSILQGKGRRNSLHHPEVCSPAPPLALDRSLHYSGLSCCLWKLESQRASHRAVVRIKHDDLRWALVSLAGALLIFFLPGASRAQGLSRDHTPLCPAQRLTCSRHSENTCWYELTLGKQRSSKRNKNTRPV